MFGLYLHFNMILTLSYIKNETYTLRSEKDHFQCSFIKAMIMDYI